MTNLIKNYKLTYDAIKEYEKYGTHRLNTYEFFKYVNLLRRLRKIKRRLYK